MRPACARGAFASAVACSCLAFAQPAPEQPSPLRAQPPERKVTFGLGATAGPALLGEWNNGWWTRAFAAVRFALPSHWHLLLEPGVAYGWSSVEGRFDGLSVNEGTLRLGTLNAPLSQEYRITAGLPHTLVGRDFGSVFSLRFGSYAGLSSATLRTDNCGSATYRGLGGGLALVPTFYLYRGLELGVQSEAGVVPTPYCEQDHANQDFTAPDYKRRERTPVVHTSDGMILSASLRLAYVGF